MQESDLIPGTRVICIYDYSDRLNKIGIIESYDRIALHGLKIKWDDNDQFCTNWRDGPKHFDFAPMTEDPTNKTVCIDCGCYNKTDSKTCWYCNKFLVV